MRLIDADRFKETVKQSIEVGEWKEVICAQIDRQPTAFNKDKVVEVLDECRKIMLSPTNIDCFGEPCKESDCLACMFNKAIEIVEKGGIDG